VISWVSVEICSSVRLARSGGRSARGVCEVEASGGGWDEDEGGSTSVLSDMVVSTKLGHETGAGGRSPSLRDGEGVRVSLTMYLQMLDYYSSVNLLYESYYDYCHTEVGRLPFLHVLPSFHLLLCLLVPVMRHHLLQIV